MVSSLALQSRLDRPLHLQDSFLCGLAPVCPVVLAYYPVLCRPSEPKKQLAACPNQTAQRLVGLSSFPLVVLVVGSPIPMAAGGYSTLEPPAGLCSHLYSIL